MVNDGYIMIKQWLMMVIYNCPLMDLKWLLIHINSLSYHQSNGYIMVVQNGESIRVKGDFFSPNSWEWWYDSGENGG